MRTILRTVICVVLFGLGSPKIALGYGPATQPQQIKNYCRTQSTPKEVRSICNGKSPLPATVTRNIRNHELLCSPFSSKQNRIPQPYDFDTWADTLAIGDEESHVEAFRMRQSAPEPKLSGRTRFHTYEEWDWEACELITSSLICGEDTICKSVPKNTYNPSTGLYSHTVTEQICETKPRSCYADIPKHESVSCSTEWMTYDITYKRPSKNEWNPSSKGYHDVIPNKYDLLPGEVENLTFKTSSKKSSMLTPNLIIENNRNVYTHRVLGSAANAVCRQDANYHANVLVYTKHRIKSSKSPNPLVLPTDMDGRPVKPLTWVESKIEGKKSAVKAYPVRLKLHDVSAALMRFVSDSSENGNGKSQFTKKFTKDTQIRIRLVKKRWWWWDEEWSRIYTYDGEVTKASLNTLSDNGDTKIADALEFDLNKGDDSSTNLYRRARSKVSQFFFGGDSHVVQSLQPNREYEIKVAIYQKGAEFYKQSCAEAPQDWDCRWWAIGPLARREKHYFSEEISIPFRTPKDFDARSGWEKFKSSVNIIERFLFWAGDKK